METILFFIKREKLLKDGTASIFVRVTFGKLAAKLQHVRVFCHSNGWQPTLLLEVDARAAGRPKLPPKSETPSWMTFIQFKREI